MDYWKHLVFPLTAVSLLLYALLWLPWLDGYRTAESLLSVLLLTMLIRFWRPWFRDDPLVRLWLLFIGFLVLVQSGTPSACRTQKRSHPVRKSPVTTPNPSS